MGPRTAGPRPGFDRHRLHAGEPKAPSGRFRHGGGRIRPGAQRRLCRALPPLALRRPRRQELAPCRRLLSFADAGACRWLPGARRGCAERTAAQPDGANLAARGSPVQASRGEGASPCRTMPSWRGSFRWQAVRLAVGSTPTGRCRSCLPAARRSFASRHCNGNSGRRHPYAFNILNANPIGAIAPGPRLRDHPGFANC